MAVPTVITGLSTTASSNTPLDSEVVGPNADNYIRAHASFIKQLYDNNIVWCGTATGTDTITLSPTVAMTAYTTGQGIAFISAGANTGAVTVNPSSLGAKSLTKSGAEALDAGDIPSGAIVEARYDGTQYQITSVSLDDDAYLKLIGGTLTGHLHMNGSFTSRSTSATGYAGNFHASGDSGADYAAIILKDDTGNNRASYWTPANSGDAKVSGAASVALRVGNAGVTGGTDILTATTSGVTTTQNIQFNSTYGPMWDSGGANKIDSDASTYIRIVTGSGERMRFNSSGAHTAYGSVFQLHNASTGGLYYWLTNNTSGSTGSDGAYYYFDGTNLRVQNSESGSVTTWTSNITRQTIANNGHQTYTAGTATIGVDILTYNDSVRDCVRFFGGADSTAYSGTQTILGVRQATTTGRSINAAGTINASGADYAEYELKSNKCGDIAKGDIIGFNKKGQVVDTFADAISFGVKSTNPNLVGGDNWGVDEGEPPIPPVEHQDPVIHGTEPEELSPTEKDQTKHRKRKAEREAWKNKIDKFDKDHKRYKKEYEVAYAKYEKDLEKYHSKLNKRRAKYDRIAYCGKVPVNGIKDAKVGDYVVPIEVDGGIGGKAVQDPDFAQYKLAVGQVKRILDDGRPEIVVRMG